MSFCSIVKELCHLGHIAVLWCLVGVIIMIGGSMISAIELPGEQQRGEEYCNAMQKIRQEHAGTAGAVGHLIDSIATGNCRTPGCDASGNFSNADINWDFNGGCFFVMTTITTIGYGTYVPATTTGKVMTMLFGVGGILVFLLACDATTKRIDRFLAENFGGIFSNQCLNWFVTAAIWVMVMSGFYSELEGWSLGDSMYFSYITMSTIGFGDFAPAATRHMFLSYVLIIVAVVIQQGLVRALLESFGGTTDVAEAQNEEKKGGCNPLECLKRQVNRIPLAVMWILLFVYMMFGGAMFRSIELTGTTAIDQSFKKAWDAMRPGGEVQDALTNTLGISDVAAGNATAEVVLTKEASVLVDSVFSLVNAQGTCPLPSDSGEEWGYINAAMFALTVFTTIGYGNVVPVTDAGKIFCVPYSLIGFWIFSLAQARSSKAMSDWFSRRASGVAGKEGCFCSCFKRLLNCFPRFSILFFAIVSCCLMLLIAALLFLATEGWPIMIGIWFSYSSMLTIGYGDFTPLFSGRNFLIELFMLSVGLTAGSLGLHVIDENITEIMSMFFCCKDGAPSISAPVNVAARVGKAVTTGTTSKKAVV